jgi:hypothetical protein
MTVDRQERLGWMLAAVLLGLLVFRYLLPVTDFFTAVPGDLSDPRFNSMVLEHLYRVFTGRGDLWSPPFFYPFEGVLAFSDSHLGSGATYILARHLGLPREQAYDAWFLVGTLLNYACALYVLRRLGVSTAAAALGAFFFSFGVPVSAQDAHAQLLHRFPLLFAFLAFWRMLERRRLVDIAWVALFTAWQFYCSIYLGIFLFYLFAAMLAAMLVTGRLRDRAQWSANIAAESPRVKLVSAGVLLVSITALVWLLSTYHHVQRTYNLWRPRQSTTELLPRLESYLLADASPLLAWLGRDVSVRMRWEHQMFIGFGAIALVLAAIVWRRRAAVAGLTEVMLGALAILFAGTLLIGDFSLYHLISWLPGIESVRGVTRILLIMMVPLSVLLALGVDAVWRPSAARGWRFPALALAVALVVTEPLSVTVSGTPIAFWRERLDHARRLLPPALPADAILALRTNSRNLDEVTWVEIDGMLLGQDLDRPVLNGYSGFFPPGYRMVPCDRPRERLRGYLLLHERRVSIASYFPRVVVVDLGRCPPALLEPVDS